MPLRSGREGFASAPCTVLSCVQERSCAAEMEVVLSIAVCRLDYLSFDIIE